MYTVCNVFSVQLTEALKYSFFLDSYNASANSTDNSTDTGNVCTSACMYMYSVLKFVYSVHVN